MDRLNLQDKPKNYKINYKIYQTILLINKNKLNSSMKLSENKGNRIVKKFKPGKSSFHKFSKNWTFLENSSKKIINNYKNKNKINYKSSK